MAARPGGHPIVAVPSVAAPTRATTRGHLADLLLKLGRTAEARAELERAAELATNERERALLLERAKGCG